MCLILLAYQAHPLYPLIVAANRDEAHARPASPAAEWSDLPGIYGGRDLEQGGTWLGISRTGRFAAVTNYREGLARSRAPRSRGALTVEYLAGRENTAGYLNRQQVDGAYFNGYSLIAGDATGLGFLSNRGGGVAAIPEGVHGLSNHLLNEPWPKVIAGKKVLQDIATRGDEAPADRLLELLSDRSPSPDPTLPSTGVTRDRERELSPIFIAGEHYGTRASTVVLVTREGAVTFMEHSFGPNGKAIGAVTLAFRLDSPFIGGPADESMRERA